MKNLFPLLLLCTAISFTACIGGEDDENEPGAVTGIVLNQSILSIEVGKTATLTAAISPEDAVVKEVTWSSSQTEVATVADGVVTAVKAGEATITATATDGSGVTGTCLVTVTEKAVEWATGNLVADGANSAKVGTATDGGLFFQFGSLIGWSETGDPTAIVKPVGYTGSTAWNSSWIGDPATENVATGTGDPCKYYLKGTWRLPTKDEYKALFNNANGKYANSGGWSWDATAKSATHSTKNLTFPASGRRGNYDGSLGYVGTDGSYWSASPYKASNGYSLGFGSSSVDPNDPSSVWAFGLSVRCVRD